MANSKSNTDSDALAVAAERHGIQLTAEQVELAAAWRHAMVSSVEAVRRIDVTGYEPAAVFKPFSRSTLDNED